MGVINSPLVEGGVFSEEVNKKEVTVNGVNSNIKGCHIRQEQWIVHICQRIHWIA